MNSPIADISYRWTHIICGLLWLAFSLSICFWVHACCSTYQNFIPFYGWIILHCMDIPHYLCSSVDEHLGCFHFGAVMNSAAMNTCVQIFLWTCAFISLGYMLRSRVAGCGRLQSGSCSERRDGDSERGQLCPWGRCLKSVHWSCKTRLPSFQVRWGQCQ